MGKIDGFDVARAEGDRRSTMAWTSVLALLFGIFVVVGAPTTAGATDPPPIECAVGSTPDTIALPSGESEAVCQTDEASTSAAPTISLVKTVGTADECATDADTTVAPGTEVFYCYTVTNDGPATLVVHDLEDDKLGLLLDSYAFDLGPGESTIATASAVIDEETTNVATWTASDGSESGQSVASATVYVSATSVPGAPAITAATAAEGSASLAWDAPVDDGGSPITGYRITPLVGGVPGTPIEVGATPTSAVVQPLANGTTYTFTVAALNANGAGPESAESVAVAPQWWLPWSTGPVAVTQMFTWMTGTAPTASQQASWLAQLDAGTKLPGDLIAELRVGPDALANVDPTIRLYSAYLTRVPDGPGLNYWLGRKRAGYTLNKISQSFANSPEFTSRYGNLSNRAFVEQIYLNVLERPGEEAGIVYWTGQLDQGKKSRGQVMINFSESVEYKDAQAGNTDAAAVYIHFLGRTPSLAERDAFAAALAMPTPLASLVRDLIHDPSFASRAG